jgi:8-oxo-dGTP pyrophosphatase MutT (NUDIX family)
MVNNGMPAITSEILRTSFTLAEKPAAPSPGLLPAGVLLPLFFNDGRPHILFTQRTFTVKDHRGQISFPGGVQDHGDADPLATALRESQEEIGLQPEVVEVFGPLPPLATVTGYWITAYVAQIPYPYEFQVNKKEVRQLLLLPLEGFYWPERWSAGTYNYKGNSVRVCYWRQEQTIIWGATARLLLHFLARLGFTPISECAS